MTRVSQTQTMDISDSSGSHMRISDEQYFRSCVAKERHLAQLLGHQNIEECYETAGTLWAGAQALPQWTRDWRACAPLLAQYKISIEWNIAPASAKSNANANAAANANANANATATAAGAHSGIDRPTVGAGETRITLADHPHPDRALMVAVVREVIRLLEHPRKTHAGPAAPLHPHP